MSGATFLPLYAFMLWTETLHFFLPKGSGVLSFETAILQLNHQTKILILMISPDLTPIYQMSRSL